MTLKQAFTFWSLIPGNTVLAARSREAVQKVLMKKYNEVELTEFTEPFCRSLFERSSEPQEIKSKAASILVHVLQWGYENNHCSRPLFTYSVAMPLDDPKGQIQESNMEDKKPRGKQPIPVAQLDPNDYKEIKIWPSRSEAERGIGVCNIDRAIARKSMAGGFFWCHPADIDGFKPNPLSVKSPMFDDKSKKTVRQIVIKSELKSPKTSLSEFSDQEIINEIKRRGWKGDITITINISL